MPELAIPPAALPQRSRKALVAIILLSVALVAATAFLAFYLVKLDAANARIIEQKREIKEQGELIEKKETFGAAMLGLTDTLAELDGVLFDSVVPFESYEKVAAQAWLHRRVPAAMDRHTETVNTATEALRGVLASARSEAASNVTGTTYEAVTDQLGAGFVATRIDDADALCAADVLACVKSDDPLTVHFDGEDAALPYMTPALETGVAYHEFAHVLQFANPVPTETALDSFDGDVESMADCFALTYLDGWKLDHRIFLNQFEYWEISIGYGYTCNEPQKQVVRAWYEELGFHNRPISQ